MKHQNIKDRARVRIVTRGPGGKLREECNPQSLGGAETPYAADDIADVLAIQAGKIEIAENRLW